jgi:hypothetical protein
MEPEKKVEECRRGERKKMVQGANWKMGGIGVVL